MSKVHDYANTILATYDGKTAIGHLKARAAMLAIPDSHRKEAAELAFQQWRMWEISNFRLPWAIQKPRI